MIHLPDKIATDSSSLLELRNLKTHFTSEGGIVKAVDGVNLSVRRGEIVGLVGESGSGKSITGFSIIGLLDRGGRNVAGSINFKGEELLGLSKTRLTSLRGNRIAMIFQDPMMTLNPVLKVKTHMIETVQAHERLSKKQALEQSIEALRLVGISQPEKRINAYPHEFSGGMRQRVAIAIALLHKPDLIIADEPTASLDPERTFGLLRLLRHIADDGAAIMLITHDIGALMDTNVADQVSVIYASRLVESGKASFLLKGGAQHPYTRDLLAALPRNGLIRMPGILPELTNLDPDYTYTTRTMQTGVQRCAA